jgi:hypothetical protein
MKVVTESGSEYEIDNVNLLMRRTNHEEILREDGNWVKMLTACDPQVGESMVLYLEPLGKGDFTVRMTSPVKYRQVEQP